MTQERPPLTSFVCSLSERHGAGNSSLSLYFNPLPNLRKVQSEAGWAALLQSGGSGNRRKKDEAHSRATETV